MAYLTQTEFQRTIELLAHETGLQRLRDRFVHFNALVTRRKVASAQSLANQLYMLTSGLRRQVPATYAFHALWSERINEKVGEDGGKTLEKMAEAVNACLGEQDEILPEKVVELDTALAEYERTLGAAVGVEMARMDMLMKAVPVVAARLRATPPPVPTAAPVE